MKAKLTKERALGMIALFEDSWTLYNGGSELGGNMEELIAVGLYFLWEKRKNGPTRIFAYPQAEG